MNQMNEKKLDALLSQYVDGVLAEKEVREVESLCAADSSIRKQVAEMKRLKELMGAKEKLTPDIGFWTRLSIELEEKKKEEHNLLPFPRKYTPAFVFLTTVVFVMAGTFLVQNRMQFIQYFSEKSKTVRDVYEKNILQGSLLPLFSKVDKDRALQFSLFGTLPLDAQSETALRVDEQSEKGCRIEVAKDLKKKSRPVTFDRFLAEVKPTAEQKQIIDSLLELTGRRIESSVLIGENNMMAIAPDLPRLNRMMVTNIASCLEPPQRIRLERLLEVNNAPYSVTSKSVPKVKEEHSFQRIPKMRRNNEFMIITPDTMMYSTIHVDFDSLRRSMEENFLKIEMKREAILKRMMTRDLQRARGKIVQLPPRMVGSEEVFSVEITLPGEENEQQQMHVVIQPRVRKQVVIPEAQNRSVRIRTWNDTAAAPAPALP